MPQSHPSTSWANFLCTPIAPIYRYSILGALPVIENKVVPRLGIHVDIEPCLAVISDVQRADIELTACVLDVLERPVPALTYQSIVRWKGRQLGLCGQLGKCPTVKQCPVIVPKIDIRLLGRGGI